MTTSSSWMERGRELGETLEHVHAVVIIGSDVMATSQVALGAARAQAARRRVAVADLIGEAPPLQSLITSDDPHGIVDSFLFGVSLNRIAQYVPDAGELFILPSGAAPIDYDEMFAHPRWRRLVAGFREVGALLVLVAPAHASHLQDLVSATDGAVIVGDTVPVGVPVSQSLAWLRAHRSTPLPAVEAPRVRAPAPAPAAAEAAPAPPRRDKRRVAAGVAGLVLTALLVVAAFWFAQRPFASKSAATNAGGALSATPPVKLTPDSAALVKADSATQVASAPPPSDSFPLLTPVNVGDSALASAYAVRLEQTNTKAGAIMDLRIKFENAPAATYGFDLLSRSFLLIAGAYPTRAGAESLLVELRTHKILGPKVGSVTSLPFAYLVEADVPAASIKARLQHFAGLGEPVYALRQPSGVAHLYFGAYESPQQAALAVPSVRGARLTPTLVYRIGRVF